MASATSRTLPGLIRELAVESRYSGLPRVRVEDLARSRIDAPHEILEWATRDRRWSFTLAELMTDPARSPRELAALLVATIVDELEQEREIVNADRLETSLHAQVNAHAE